MSMSISPPLELAEPRPAAAQPQSLWRKVLRNASVRIGGGLLLVITLVALLAPWLGTIDPNAIDPASANQLPGAHVEFNSLDGRVFPHTFKMGSDSLGRDIWSRAAFGARVSISIAVAVASAALIGGVAIGLLAGYFRRADGVLMRFMDGVMAIPSILFAICLVAMAGASVLTVTIAIAIPEIPRVARLVRALVLSLREEAYVEAAVSLGTPAWKILLRHILPNAVAPLIIQGTYIGATAILLEAIMSFLGVGLPADMATWGNLMAEGRSQFNQFPHNVLLPGALLALTVFAVNMLGDGLRDTLDPKFNKRAG
jgi:peptide/nickel transport system permease protein